MSNDIQEYLNKHKNSLFFGIDGVQLTGEIADLSEFINLGSLEISNSLITNTNLDFLNTLPNKEKLKAINFSGNRIKEVDFADLFTKFPNLEKINLQNNPISTKNLNNLTNQQFAKLVNKIKEQKIKIDPLNSSKKTISKDLLDYARKLIANGNNQHAYQLQEIILEKEEKQLNNGGNNKIPLLISGLIVFTFFVLVISCWLRQKRKKTFYE